MVWKLIQRSISKLCTPHQPLQQKFPKKYSTKMLSPSHVLCCGRTQVDAIDQHQLHTLRTPDAKLACPRYFGAISPRSTTDWWRFTNAFRATHHYRRERIMFVIAVTTFKWEMNCITESEVGSNRELRWCDKSSPWHAARTHSMTRSSANKKIARGIVCVRFSVGG